MTNFRRLPVRLSGRFMALYRALDPQLKRQTKAAVIKLSKNPNTRGLHLEPIKSMPGYWSIRVNDNFRLLLRVVEEDQAAYYELADLGSHDIYRN